MSADPLSQRRIVLWCPYVHWHIAPTIASKVLGQMGSSKYQWLQRIIRQYRENIYVYCDAWHTSLVHYHGHVLGHIDDPGRRKEITLAEARLWNELNNFQIPAENFIDQPSQVQAGDIIFTFATYFLDQPLTDAKSDLYRVFSRDDVFKVAHLTHYIFHLSHLAANLKLLKVQMLCYESNLAKYKFFQRYFPYVKSVALIPFAVQDRFKAVLPFDQRRNKCVATGGLSSHPMTPALMEFFFEYSSNNFYPLRVFLTENAAAIADYIDVKTCWYETAMKDARRSSVAPSSWEELVHRPIEEIRRIDAGKKITYYSEDMVATYNQYRFSYVSDEVHHAPALGFFESMACGAIPLGIDDDIYRDVGLVKNVNYLAFDGSFGGLMTALVQAQNDPEAVRHIPEQNEKLMKGFTEARVAEIFIGKLVREYRAWSPPARPRPARTPERMELAAVAN